MPRTKIVTINLPAPYVRALETLADAGRYPSRSEAIRVALRDFLPGEIALGQALQDLATKQGEA